MEEKVHTRIWDEDAEPDNAFAAASCYCHGYDVYGDLLGKASWFEYLYLLFRGEAPTVQQAKLLEGLALAIANPGPRDASVHAAMCGGVGGSTAASCLTAALAVGAGSSGGAREIYNALENWQARGTDLAKWLAGLKIKPVDDPADVWPAAEHPAGFDPYGVRCTSPVLQTLEYLSGTGNFVSLKFLANNRVQLEGAAGVPLAMTGVSAAAFNDLGCTPDQGEMLFLMLRLPGAAVHALEQKGYGYKNFPFFEIELENDPGPISTREERVGADL
jgi:citrate synthase